MADEITASQDDEAALTPPENLRCVVCGAPAIETPQGNATCGRDACARAFDARIFRALAQKFDGATPALTEAESKRRALELHGTYRSVRCGECGAELRHFTSSEQNAHVDAYEGSRG